MQMVSTRSRSDNDFFELKEAVGLPKDLRDELKNPLGEVVDENHLKDTLAEVEKIVSVGDQCSLSLFEMGIEPDIAIVDFRVKRGDVGEKRARIQKIGQSVINVKNPAGVITKELWEAVEKAYSADKKVRIEVQGEEDLATLPCVWLAPKNTAIVYGLPGIGLVVVLDRHKARKKVKDVLIKMK
ncbi:MAG: DUF359 domain-containing protein [Methanomassiliicoccales archaeon]|nr:MAG: DUF359 domain-containing protein [Methanomassiliicoccales archaeon]